MFCKVFRLLFYQLFFIYFSCISSSFAKFDTPVHGYALHGSPKYPEDFKYFDYIEPSAPKGGKLIVHTPGATFDSLNPFILKGTPASGLFRLHQNDLLPAIAPVISESLLINSLDEPFTMYGLIAKTIEVPKTGQYVRFILRPEARFQDGSYISVKDVIFSFNKLISEGDPLYKAYFGDIDYVEQTGIQEVTFFFKNSGNSELPLIIGQMPILSESYWSQRDFSDNGLQGPLGSGPYRIKDFEPGRFIEYERIKNYWGKDLPVNIGRHNFDEIRFDYYRDETVAFEAFMSGEYDIRYENSARNWAVRYSGEKVLNEKILKESFKDNTPAGMQGFVFNTRKEIFSDLRVRQALSYAFDFSWTNKAIFYDQYKRTRSYFQNSELSASEIPKGFELKILEKYKNKLSLDLYNKEYNPPHVDENNSLRSNLLKSVSILKESGWIQNSSGYFEKNGKPFEFEILLRSPSFERIVAPFIKNLKKIGIKAQMRTVDSSQWINRIQAFDFDMIVFSWGQSLSPGNEQRNYWGSLAADQQGSRNFSGVKSPVVDELIEGLILAETRNELVAYAKAIDRVLQWGYYVIPNWYSPDTRVAFWNKFSYPPKIPLLGISISTWWFDIEKYEKFLGGEKSNK